MFSCTRGKLTDYKSNSYYYLVDSFNYFSLQVVYTDSIIHRIFNKYFFTKHSIYFNIHWSTFFTFDIKEYDSDKM